MKSFYWILATFLIIESKIDKTLGQSRVRQTYGASCNNKTLKCEGNAWLKCNEGICGCTNPDEMKWDLTRNRCVALAGERCIYESREDSGNVIEKINCVENSVCNTLGFCQCSNRFYASAEGICALKKVYGISCMENIECNSEVSLHCTNGFCRCNTTVSAYSKSHMHCVGLASEKPIDLKCIPNAYTQYYSNGIYRCLCSSGFATSIKKFCVRQYSDLCSKTELCDEDARIMCKSKSGEIPIKLSCQCRDSKHQYYNSTSKTCESFIHGVCENNFDCTKNAICIDKEGTGVSRCKCDQGYVENADGKCDLEFGARCSLTGTVHCDRHANLVCENSVCSCGDDNLIFDKKLRKCVGLPGSRCGSLDKCVENSECVESFSELKGTCECNEGFKNIGAKCEIDDEKNFVEIETTTPTHILLLTERTETTTFQTDIQDFTKSK